MNRLALCVLAAAALFAAPAVFAAVDPPVSPTERVEQTNGLTRDLLTALDARCPEGEEDAFLAIIQNLTASQELEVVAAALQILGQEVDLCAPARAAIASASQAAQLALEGGPQDETGATGGRGGRPFARGGPGPSANSGGGGYIENDEDEEEENDNQG